MFPFGHRAEFRERRDKVYVWRQCGKAFFFRSDVQDHFEQTKHDDAEVIYFDQQPRQISNSDDSLDLIPGCMEYVSRPVLPVTDQVIVRPTCLGLFYHARRGQLCEHDMHSWEFQNPAHAIYDFSKFVDIKTFNYFSDHDLLFSAENRTSSRWTVFSVERRTET